MDHIHYLQHYRHRKLMGELKIPYVLLKRMSLSDIITKNKPKINPRTAKGYLDSVSIVARALKLDLSTLPAVLKHADKIFDYIKKTYKPNSRKTRLAAFVVLIDDKTNTHKAILDKFRKEVFDCAGVVMKREEEQKLNESQEKAFMPWEDVMKVYQRLKGETAPLWRSNVSNVNKTRIRDFVLLSMYVLIPPRRSADYYNFKIRDIDRKKDNYVVDDQLVFNSYKNSAKIGQQEVKAPKELIDLIHKWTKINKSEWLIPSNSGTQMSQTGLTGILNRVFGRKISSSMLRHIYLTKRYGDVDLQDLNETTRKMGSNVIERTLKYVRKEK